VLRIHRILLMSVLASSLGACATFTTDKADLDKEPNGVRIYAPKVYLMVDESQHRTTIALLPDYTRAYDVRPWTILSKQDFKIELEDGQLKTLTENADTTAILKFITDAAQLGAKAAGLPVSNSIVTGTFGLPSGVYTVTDDGNLKQVKVLP
jgi:hypothetical protein